MRITLRVWRQRVPTSRASSSTYVAESVSPDMSFLEMLDVVNEGLIAKGEDPIAFDSDCREGICGTCGFLVDGIAHGPMRGTTVCQLHMRSFKDGDTLTLEPWRAQAFPVVKDLVVDRSGVRPDHPGGRLHVDQRRRRAGRQRHPRSRSRSSDQAMDSAACIGCGACVAACKNASAALFTSAKISHLALLPQGQVGTLCARRRHGRSARRRRLRQLLQRGGVRGGLPEGDLDHQHRADEPRVFPGHSVARTLTGPQQGLCGL